MTVFPYLPSQISALVWSNSLKVKTKALWTKIVCDFVIKAYINICKRVWAAQNFAFLLELSDRSSHLSSKIKHFFPHLPEWIFVVFLTENPSSTMPKNDVSISFATTHGVWTTDLQHCKRDLHSVWIKGIKNKVRRGKQQLRAWR